MLKTRKPKSRKKAAPQRPRSAPARDAVAPVQPPQSASAAADERVLASDLTLHELFAQQTRAMLDRADLTEEQKQTILIGMNCPCCGAGGLSFTAKLKRSI